jgi:multidrug efflux pump subunit AcrB
MPARTDPPPADLAGRHGGFTNAIVRMFLHSNLPLLLLILATIVGVAALALTPREEDPQIVVPMADVYVNFPGRSAAEVENLVATPLERILYHIDGVEYVYSMSRPGQAVITVRFHVGQDRERSVVKLFKKINENVDVVPPGVTGWVIKPVEIDDVPIVTLTLAGRGGDEFALRRVGEELVSRLAGVPDVSRAYVVGGQRRVAYVRLDAEGLSAHSVDPLDVRRAIQAANVAVTAGDAARNDRQFRVEAGQGLVRADQLKELVVGVFDGRPVFLKDVAEVRDGPEELAGYVRHNWGPARGADPRPDAPSAALGSPPADGNDGPASAVTLALAKKTGTNAVTVADHIVAAANRLRGQIVPWDMQLIVTRNTGLASNDKVNELVEALAVALLLAAAVLLVGMGWRESLIVALAVPVVFGLTLAVNLLAGYTINRVTLFAMILALGLLVDDPIVDVENIARHFTLRRRASRAIVLEAVSEIRPPLISATIAVIVSFLPMLFITGMMGPYMRPMALNVPVAMVMSMVVAFTITPWLTYRFLRRRYTRPGGLLPPHGPTADAHGLDAARSWPLYPAFQFLLGPMLRRRWAGWAFLALIGLLMAGAVALAATRRVPLKMLPFGNRNDFQLVVDTDEGTTLQRTDAVVRRLEQYLRAVPEVADVVSYVGLAAPMDFNGMVRHYYLRTGPNVADLQVNLADRKWRTGTTHEITLRIRRDLAAIAAAAGARLKIVEPPPGPPVYATIAAEVYAAPGQDYDDLLAAARAVEARFAAEEGVTDIDSTIETPWTRLTFVPDLEKAALNGVAADQIADVLRIAVEGGQAGTLRVAGERHPLEIILRLPRPQRSSTEDLSRLHVRGAAGQLVPLAELGLWRRDTVDQTIYHKNLQPVVYVFGEVVGRAPAEAVVDILADQRPSGAAMPADAARAGAGWVSTAAPRPPAARTFLHNGAGLAWALPNGARASFTGEGEWQLTLDVFRDMGLAFLAAVAAIYILLVGQTKSFVIPLVIMMAIPLTIIGIMPGFWLLNLLGGATIGGYGHGIFFTATAMIGMIALAGIVTRNSIILVDFIHLSLRRGRPLMDSIIDSVVVRFRPILLTAATALLSALPIVADPIFSGLAWALIFGLLASTAFTLLVIPVAYWLLYANRPGHGLPMDDEEDGSHAASSAKRS